MLKYYNLIYTTYYHGKVMGSRVDYTLCEEPEVKKELFHLTWDNLSEMYDQNKCAFNIYHFKKGRQVSFFSTWPWQEPKEWKRNRELDIDIELKYVEQKLTMKDLFRLFTIEEALQYIKEMEACQELKGLSRFTVQEALQYIKEIETAIEK